MQALGGRVGGPSTVTAGDHTFPEACGPHPLPLPVPLLCLGPPARPCPKMLFPRSPRSRKGGPESLISPQAGLAPSWVEASPPFRLPSEHCGLSRENPL